MIEKLRIKFVIIRPRVRILVPGPFLPLIFNDLLEYKFPMKTHFSLWIAMSITFYKLSKFSCSEYDFWVKTRDFIVCEYVIY